MTPTEEGKALIDAVFEDIDDQPRKLVYADWLEENGRDVEADCWRWFAAAARRPSETFKGNHYWNTKKYAEFFREADPDEKYLIYSNLPKDWLQVLTGDVEGAGYNKGFEKIERAFAEAVNAWANKLTPEQRAECWRWNP